MIAEKMPSKSIERRCHAMIKSTVIIKRNTFWSNKSEGVCQLVLLSFMENLATLELFCAVPFNIKIFDKEHKT